MHPLRQILNKTFYSVLVISKAFVFLVKFCWEIIAHFGSAPAPAEVNRNRFHQLQRDDSCAEVCCWIQSSMPSLSQDATLAVFLSALKRQCFPK